MAVSVIPESVLSVMSSRKGDTLVDRFLNLPPLVVRLFLAIAHLDFDVLTFTSVEANLKSQYPSEHSCHCRLGQFLAHRYLYTYSDRTPSEVFSAKTRTGVSMLVFISWTIVDAAEGADLADEKRTFGR